ncbi:hypothetical protein Y032_0021g302 [Ancylostoma ceylanicum]|uniref:MADF domain-containing protein n=2 Tax=Ancylostoma ceylanicum TaxID=53326 RepID=A0A016V1L2_9BILA|nr:hypothetical protein Y032_0021g302 [Ancylostoma ceylanicum]
MRGTYMTGIGSGSVKREPRVAEVWTNELREALIDEVRGYSNLWNGKSKSFKDAHGKDLDWIRITSKFNADHSTNFDVAEGTVKES